MEPFFVSPSEAVLLGYCTGLYMLPEWPQASYFLDVVNEWLTPLIPSLHNVSRKEIPAEDLPNDVVWDGSSAHRSGISPRYPNTIYFHLIHEEKFFVEKVDTTRRSLIELLASYLGDLIVRSQWDKHWNFPPTGSPNLAVFYKFLIQNSQEEADWERLLKRSGKEDKEKVQGAISALVAYNECEVYFGLGKAFGVAVGKVQSLQHLISSIDHHEYLSFSMEKRYCEDNGFVLGLDQDEEYGYPGHYEVDQADCQETLDNDVNSGRKDLSEAVIQLQANPFLKRMFVADRSLSYVQSVPARLVWSFDTQEFEMNRWSALRDLDRIRLWTLLGFGEVLGALREADMDAKREEWATHSPRTFRDLFDVKGDKVREALAAAEKELNESTYMTRLPERLIRGLGGSIEAIVRRLWPMNCASIRQAGFDLAATLHEKRSRGTELEQRFASIAIALYKSYRNPAEHEFDSFKCSFDEAKFFLSGIRTLLQLAEQIEAARDGTAR